MSGISALIHVTQMKASNANDQAMAGAAKQRALLNQQKQLRAVQTTFGSPASGYVGPVGYGYPSHLPF